MCVHANYDRCLGWSSPVGSYPVGAQSSLSDPIHDLAGNVYEWCNDWFQCSLGELPVVDPTGPPSGSIPVLRGGAFDASGLYMKAAYRDNVYSRSQSRSDLGFRLARTAVP